jgi:hypothetical protein
MSRRKLTAGDVERALDTEKPGYYQEVADRLNAIINPPKLVGHLELVGRAQVERGGQARITVDQIPVFSTDAYGDLGAFAESVKSTYGIVHIESATFSTGFPSI